MSSFNPILDALERHVGTLKTETDREVPFNRKSVHARRLRAELRKAMSDMLDSYEGYEGDNDMLIMMFREDISQL